jgi:hypothetical protein
VVVAGSEMALLVQVLAASLGRRHLPALHRWAPYANIATATAVLIVGISLTATSLP